MISTKRLIDANILKTLFDVRYDTAFIQERTRENKEQWNGYCAGINWGRNTIADAPTVDAVEVVRCKECKHYVPERKHPWNEETGYDFTKVEILQFGECRGQNAIFTEDGSVNVHENDFCSNGERKTDG